jgi:hypothetical protein
MLQKLGVTSYLKVNKLFVCFYYISCKTVLLEYMYELMQSCDEYIVGFSLGIEWILV